MTISFQTLSHLPLALVDNGAAEQFRERVRLSRPQEAALRTVEDLVASAPFDEGPATWCSARGDDITRSGFVIEDRGLKVLLGANLTLPAGSYYLIATEPGQEGPVLDLRISRIAGNLLSRLEDRHQREILLTGTAMDGITNG